MSSIDYPYKKLRMPTLHMTSSTKFKYKTILFCLAWYTISSISSIINKIILQKYPYPMTLALSNLLCVPLYSIPILQLWETREVKLTNDQYNKFLVPISIGKAIAVGSAYFSLWKVPVSYAHTVKASMPLFAVILSRLILKESQSYRVYVSLLPIVAGVIIASATELSFSASGFLAAICSTFTYSVLSILVKKLLKISDMHPIRLLSLNSQLAAIMFIPFWFFKDAVAMFNSVYYPSPSTQAPELWMLFMLVISGLLSFLQNVCAFSLIHQLTALSYSVCNATKRITVIGASLMALHNPVTMSNLFGIFLSIFGVFLYNRAKQMDKTAHILPHTRHSLLQS